MKRALALVAIASTTLTLSLAFLSTGAAAAVTPTVKVKPQLFAIAATGGARAIRAITSGGATCTWTSSPRVHDFDGTAKCARSMSRVARLSPSYSTALKRFKLTLKVTTKGRTASSHTFLVQERYVATPIVPTTSLVANTTAFPSTGGYLSLSFSSTGASSCTLSSTPELWSGADPASVGCAGNYVAELASSTVGGSWVFTFTAVSSSGISASSSTTVTEAAPSAIVNANWAGYVVASPSVVVTDTSGEWTVPTLDCALTPNAGDGIWVGTGGANAANVAVSGDLLQTGVTDNCVNGVQQDFGWWEEVPNTPNVAREFNDFPVAPGNVISAAVYELSNGLWETALENVSTGLTGIMVTGEGWGVSTSGDSGDFSEQGSTVGLTYSGGYSAEWIVEDYTEGIGGALVPFADFGTVAFGNLQTSLPTWSLTPGEAQVLAQGGTTLATPSNPSGGGFAITYDS